MRSKRLTVMMLGLLWMTPLTSADNFYIEIDYMTDTDHDHRPSAAVINAVVQMFACEGHSLTVQVDDQLPHRDVMVRDASCNSFFGYNNGDWNSYGYIKQQRFDHSGSAQPWHYCVFGHQYQNKNSSGVCVASGSSGLATGGEDFVVTLGSFSGQTGTEFDKAATLAHEFGHNLGLGHCGAPGNNCGDDTQGDYIGPYVSNLPSVMSYRYQLAGVYAQMLCRGLIRPEALFKNIDYSHGTLCTLNENSLDERMGAGMIWTDWNADGVEQTNLAKDISGNRNWCDNGNRTYVSDYNEWGNLDDGAVLSKSKSLEAQQELDRRKRDIERQPCIDFDEAMKVRGEFEKQGCPSCSQASLFTESCDNGDNVFLGNEVCLLGICIHAGLCNYPQISVQTAHDASPTGSVFYLEPKTYNESGTVLLNRRGLWTCDRTDGTCLIR